MTKMTMRTAFAQPGFATLALGFACCLCVRDMPQFLAIEDLNAIPVTQYLLAALRGAVFLIVLAVSASPCWRKRFVRGGRLATLHATLAAPMACVGLALLEFSHAISLRAAGCALLGVGQSFFLLSWVLRLFEVPRRTMFYALMVAAGSAGVAEMLLAGANPFIENVVTLVFPLASWALQIHLLRMPSTCGDPESGMPSCPVFRNEHVTWFPQGPSTERTFALSAGAAATLFTYFAYSFVIRQLTDMWMVHGEQGSLVLFQLFGGAGTALSAGVIYFLFHLRKSRKSPATYTAFALPLLMAVLYLSTFMTGDLSIVYVLPLFIMRKMLLVLVIVGALYYRQGVDRVRFFASAFVFVELASVAQTAFYEFAHSLPENGSSLCSAVVFALVAFIAVREIAAYAKGSDDQEPSVSWAAASDAAFVPAPAAPALTTEQVRHAAIEQLREEFGLTARETEVAELLATGRNAEHIAGELFIAHSTAKSHIAHIYQKTGLNSQQRLMDAVEKRMESLGWQ